MTSSCCSCQIALVYFRSRLSIARCIVLRRIGLLVALAFLAGLRDGTGCCRTAPFLSSHKLSRKSNAKWPHVATGVHLRYSSSCGFKCSITRRRHVERISPKRETGTPQVGDQQQLVLCHDAFVHHQSLSRVALRVALVPRDALHAAQRQSHAPHRSPVEQLEYDEALEPVTCLLEQLVVHQQNVERIASA